ncbi:MAG: hypothetical protein JW704_07605 [Anaerolineaceae bacterium]|nr:hypothetical protein [Anaerolineaceae bacterium]MBN2677376.1 hypothetical protein [Anaerolineaceae bacterium]
MSELVQCHSGFRYADRPVSFLWESNKYKITRIIQEGKTEGGLSFTVATKSDSVFRLLYDECNDQWLIYPAGHLE